MLTRAWSVLVLMFSRSASACRAHAAAITAPRGGQPLCRGMHSSASSGAGTMHLPNMERVPPQTSHALVGAGLGRANGCLHAPSSSSLGGCLLALDRIASHHQSCRPWTDLEPRPTTTAGWSLPASDAAGPAPAIAVAMDTPSCVPLVSSRSTQSNTDPIPPRAAESDAKRPPSTRSRRFRRSSGRPSPPR